MPDPDPLGRLLADDLVRREAGRTRTTPRWQAAVARAALRLQDEGAPWRDLRLPIAAALLELYPAIHDEALVPLVEAMLPVEESEIGPAPGVR